MLLVTDWLQLMFPERCRWLFLVRKGCNGKMFDVMQDCDGKVVVK